MSQSKHTRVKRSGGLASWSIKRPVSVIMLSLTVLVVGLFSFDRLHVNLLPDIIYPDIRVRILEPGTSTKIMEDKFTRQLEEQLAITEGATRVQSGTSEGRSEVNLSFPYGTDIDRALQDASTRLDRAKRFLPVTTQAPIIYKLDPSQIPVMVLMVSSASRSSIDLRSWVDYDFSKTFLNIQGVASAEVGGGLVREIQVIVDQEKLAAAGFELNDIKKLLEVENQDISSGVLYMSTHKISTRTDGRFDSIEAISNLPLPTKIKNATQNNKQYLQLRDVAKVIDTNQDEELRIRLNKIPGIKLSIQKQPDANTVDVARRITEKVNWYKNQNLLPADINIEIVNDQSIYVKRALNNAGYAAISGALLAMLVVYAFLHDIRRTLIIASAIPLAIFITFLIMGLSDISLNIMSLGGLALGVGLLVDNTIVMLENISRHQNLGEASDVAAENAAAEVTSAITASTTTNLAAVVPFLFIGGLIGLLFNELIITLSAAIFSSLIVALTLIPALGAKIQAPVKPNNNRIFDRIQALYLTLLEKILPYKLITLCVFSIALIFSTQQLLNSKDIFFPKMDEGKITIGITTEVGTRLEELDKTLQHVESLVLKQPEVKTVMVSSGGFIYGRSQFQRSHRGTINVQLKSLKERNYLSSKAWIKRIRGEINKMQLAGFKTWIYVKGVRGIRTSLGDDDLSLRIQGTDITVLSDIADKIISKLKTLPQLSNLTHNYESQSNELVIKINRQRAADLNISTEKIGLAVQLAVQGQIATQYIDGDKEYNVRLRLKREEIKNVENIKNIIISINNGQAIRLYDVASISLEASPSVIKRDNQLRINEISASLNSDFDYTKTIEQVLKIVDTITLPDGYTVYDGGTLDALNENNKNSYILLALAVFLVFVVMAVQYESLTNPLIIILGVPFSLIGVYLAITFALDNQLSMPAKLGIIMLAGIIVNNSIVLVEQIEISRQKNLSIFDAVLEAASLRLRPIFMTTLTSVFGMLPLALGFNEGSEMLKPLATIVVYGLTFSLLVSLILIPMLYLLFHKKEGRS